jgi:hypothetical protein
MANGEYVSVLMPSLAILRPWVPYQESTKNYVVNGRSWTVMTPIWVWLAYPLVASVVLRYSDPRWPLGYFLIACIMPYSLVLVWQPVLRHGVQHAKRVAVFHAAALPGGTCNG